MRFSPVSEEDAAGCLPKGEYDAVVATATEKTSKAGNPMIEVELTVYGQGGAEIKVRDWLIGNESGQRKIQRFCKSADLWETYQAGELCADSCIGLNVSVKLGVQDSEEYGPQNRVSDYVPRKAVSSPAKPPEKLDGVAPEQRAKAGTGRKDPAKPPGGDDIPF